MNKLNMAAIKNKQLVLVMLLLVHFSLSVHFAKKCDLSARPKTIFLHLPRPTENIASSCYVCASGAPRIWQGRGAQPGVWG